MSAPAAVRHRLLVRGIVQGVGFRPHLARLAAELAVAGSCRNDSTSVIVEVEGPPDAVARFEARLRADAPPLAVIDALTSTEVPATGGRGFVIEASSHTEGDRTMVPPDTAPCPDCLRELADPGDRHYRHPFVSCTHCGPRLTIALDLPYDRPATTMAPFPMCPACAAEYANPTDRRYHAQPIACRECGPTIAALAPDGTRLARGTEDTLDTVIEALRGGRIVAIKGVGGYHLACDADDSAAVARLRERKHRPDQPFAVMAADPATARRLVRIDDRVGAGAHPAGTAEEVLTGPQRPIVLLPARPDAAVAPEVAPGLGELGVVLPYTPLHHLLFAERPGGRPGAPSALVMTSGNVSGEPLCHTDADALDRLAAIADLFLVHDREIAVPCEDSVVAYSAAAGAVPVRRSRGYAPLPVALAGGYPDRRHDETVLAAGAEVKNTIALSRAGRGYVSAHVGDLASLASRDAHRRVTDQLLGFHRSAPSLVVCDRHPGYASRAWARAMAAELHAPLLEVQHHHAHLAALAAEHGCLDEPILGLVYDGTGYGCDATVWGGELLQLRPGTAEATRWGHLGDIRLPGGDSGVRNPVRTAALALLAAGVPLAGTTVGEELSEQERALLTRAHDSGLGHVATSSAGRLFDVVASVLGIRHRISYEAQAAIELEAAARRGEVAGAATYPLPLPVRTDAAAARIDPAPLLRALVEADGVGADTLAWSFHLALAGASAELARHGTERAARAGVPTRHVGLTGGVFVNRILLAATAERLADADLVPLTHRVVPANDGGLSLGQVAVGVTAGAATEN